MNADHLRSMAHSPVRNYVIPGLTSWLIGDPTPTGVTRMFTCEREHRETISPHSHRFDFRCLVVNGWVRNILWLPCEVGDAYAATVLRYGGTMGKYEREVGAVGRWAPDENTYASGMWYGMTAEEVHSIHFSRGAVVLFFEGPSRLPSSIVLDPVVDGEVVPVSAVQPWMFKRESARKATPLPFVGGAALREGG